MVFTKEDRDRLNDMPEFSRFLEYLNQQLLNTEGKILSCEPDDIKSIARLQGKREAFKTILRKES